MFTKEQMEQFKRDRAFINEGYKDQNTKQANAFSTSQSSVSSAQTRRVKSPGRKWPFGGPRFYYPVMEKQRWIKPAIIICCAVMLLSMLMPWFGNEQSAFSITFTGWSFPSLYEGYKIPMLLFVFSVAVIIWYAVIYSRKGFPENSAVLLSLPAVLLMPLLLNSNLNSAAHTAFGYFTIAFWTTCFAAVALSGIGVFLRFYTVPEKIKLPADDFLENVKYFLYCAFIFTGMFLACAMWATGGHGLSLFDNTDDSIKYLASASWLYLTAASVLWILFYKHQFIRVWFHLIAFYAFFSLLLNFMLGYLITGRQSDTVLIFLADKIPYVITVAALMSWYIGRSRSCPSCGSMFGKKLVTHSKSGISSRNYQTTESMRVDEAKYDLKVPAYETYGKKDDEHIDVKRQKTETTYHYNTQNICKHCGHQWQGHESHTQWWYRPM